MGGKPSSGGGEGEEEEEKDSLWILRKKCTYNTQIGVTKESRKNPTSTDVP